MERERVDLSCEVLEDGGEINGGAGAHALGVSPFLQVPPDPTNGELKARLHRPRYRLLPRTSSLPSSSTLLSLTSPGALHLHRKNRPLSSPLHQKCKEVTTNLTTATNLRGPSAALGALPGSRRRLPLLYPLPSGAPTGNLCRHPRIRGRSDGVNSPPCRSPSSPTDESRESSVAVSVCFSVLSS